MKMVLTLLALTIASLTGCASDIMAGYVGKSIMEPMLDFGRPNDVFDLGDGRRAFQWKIDASGVIPISTPTYTTVYGPNGWATVTTTSTNYVPYSNQCVYTMTAQKSGNDWIVDGFRKPSLACE